MPTFTGQIRARRTSRLVASVDALAKWTITLGGIGTILSVLGVCAFLVWVALPLLVGGEVEARTQTPRAGSGRIVHLAEDDYRHAGVIVDAAGTAVAFATRDGTEFDRKSVFDPNIAAVAARDDTLLLGRGDGKVQFLTVRFSSAILDRDAVPAAAQALAVGAEVTVDGTLFAQTHAGQYRAQQLVVDREAPLDLGTTTAVARLDWSDTSQGQRIVAVTADGVLHLQQKSTRYNFLEDREIVELSGAHQPLAAIAPEIASRGLRPVPDHLFLTGAGDNVLLLWNDGSLLRLDARDLATPALAESIDTLPGLGRVGHAAFLIGKSTLLIGDDGGAVHSWFGTKPDAAATSDGIVMARARTFDAVDGSAVVDIVPSRRSRLFAVAHENGALQVLQGTSGKTIARAATLDGAPSRIALCPKEDGVIVAGPSRVERFDVRPGHPEVSLASAFLPVWYEGAAAPTHTWQSTSGTDEFEPKLGLWVLIFGTLKATFYCLLFGVPIALLAAIYTSEFLQPKWRARIKPSIELMASLPSVVLGFLAALVFAPVVSEHLVAGLCVLFCVPLVFLLGAQLWQLLPRPARVRAESWRLWVIAGALPAGIALANSIGPGVEALLFGGDFKAWLALGEHTDPASRGSAFGGWILALIPVGALLAFLSVPRLLGGLAGRTAGLQRFGAGLVATFAITAALALLATASGFDLRGITFGIFDPRNSLVVGFAMGFAVIPIIYTIAEDALSAVPDHLRAASLGAGATPWQTAVRIVLPTAMSGVFSAVMVGFGRAVGETMIVVMATGSTPVLDWNVFNGFRTLAACIAIELPEAVRDSTHYRMLYLAALCLFAFTFTLNTIAEVVRQRFRKRAYQL